MGRRKKLDIAKTSGKELDRMIEATSSLSIKDEYGNMIQRKHCKTIVPSNFKYPRYITPIYFEPEHIFVDEEFLPITEQAIPDIFDCYLISNYGRIYNHMQERFIEKNYMSSGRVVARMRRFDNYGRVNVEVALMRTFFYEQGCEIFDIKHLDGNKRNLAYWNLRWIRPGDKEYKTTGYNQSV